MSESAGYPGRPLRSLPRGPSPRSPPFVIKILLINPSQPRPRSSRLVAEHIRAGRRTAVHVIRTDTMRAELALSNPLDNAPPPLATPLGTLNGSTVTVSRGRRLRLDYPLRSRCGVARDDLHVPAREGLTRVCRGELTVHARTRTSRRQLRRRVSMSPLLIKVTVSIRHRPADLPPSATGIDSLDTTALTRGGSGKVRPGLPGLAARPVPRHEPNDRHQPLIRADRRVAAAMRICRGWLYPMQSGTI